jgi:gliding motility-associated-like protein
MSCWSSIRPTFLLVPMLALAGVVPAQDWECIQVLNDGSVDLGWAPDTQGAAAYSVVPLLPPPDYTSLPATDYDLTTYPTGVNWPLLTTTQEFCFTIYALDGAGSTMAGPSDTVCSIFLELAAGVVPGTVDLAWNSPFHFSPPPGFSGTYAVEQLLPDGSWTVIASAPWLIGNSNTSFPVTQCDGTVTYRVTLTEDGPFGIPGCVHRSNQASVAVADEVDPSPPQIVAIDVDSLSGLAEISWEPSPEPDVAGYIVYICSGSIETVLTTIEDPTQLSWTNAFSNVANTIEYYNVAAFDSCYVGGVPDPGAANPACAPSTYLDVDWTQCTDRADLQWSPVVHWPGGVDRYEIWISELTQDGVQSGPQLLDVVPGTLTIYEHVGATIGSLYRYRVIAHAAQGPWTQSSNVAENLFTYPGGPEWIRWNEVSIVTDSVAVLRAEADASSSEPHVYELWRNEPYDDDYEYVTSRWSTGGPIQMLDSTIEGGLGQYKYYLKVVNACADSVLGTSIAETVYLTGTVLEERLANALSWTGFEGWDAPRDRQVLLRGVQYGGTLEEIEDFGAFDFSHDDELEDQYDAPGEFCYRVRAEQSDSGWASISNEVCLTLPPVVWIPNALVHNGFNNTWKPSVAFADVTEYRVDVFSRWGDLIWTTQDPDAAWDGTKDGALLPEAFYPYTLRIQDGAGRVVARMGHVQVVRRP